MNGLPGSEGIFSKFGLRLFFGVNYYYFFWTSAILSREQGDDLMVKLYITIQLNNSI